MRDGAWCRVFVVPVAMMACAWLLPADVDAQEEPSTPAGSEAEGAAAEEESAGYGLNIDMMYSTLYVFRGYNVFQDSSQMDQHGFLAPSITWSVFDTGLSIGYWGAFQLYGERRRAMIDEAIGAEQDLYLTYDFDLIEELLSASLSLYWYFYPFADRDVTGFRFSSWLEPGLTVTLSTVVDVSLQIVYMAALHETAWYVYFRPSISKSFELHSMVSLDLAFGFGYKIYNSSADYVDNIWDVQLDVGLTISPLDWLYIVPAVHAGWSDFEGRDFADEYLIWGSLNVGVDL